MRPRLQVQADSRGRGETTRIQAGTLGVGTGPVGWGFRRPREAATLSRVVREDSVIRT